MTKDERDYRDVCAEMTDRTLALASLVAANSVKRGVSYRLAYHAVRAALYQGLFGITLRGMKNDREMPSSLQMEEAFVTPSHHEAVAHEIVKVVFSNLKTVDPRFVWAMNIVKRKKRASEF